MIRCPNCHIDNVVNSIYCRECGTSLIENDKRKTDPLDADEAGRVDQTADPGGTSSLEPGSRPGSIRLKIGPSQREVNLRLDNAIHIGRADPNLDILPEVDVTEDIAPEKSVSRRHAVIFQQGETVLVEDVGSINGTYVNGKRLDAFTPQALYNDDTVRLGKLLIVVELAA
jgi:pSer/pThr/pTyr-binding forkhead associated (FHA) protein